MNEQRSQRLAALAGVAAAVLVVVGTALAVSGPDWMDEPGAVADHYADDTLRIMVGSYATVLGALALIWFAAGLSGALRRADPGDSMAATLCFGGGVSAGILLLVMSAINSAAALRADEDGRIDPGAAAALFDVAGELIAATAFACALVALATAIVALRTGLLPRWLGVATAAIGVGLLTPFNWIVLDLFALWLLVVAALLVRRSSQPATTVTRGAAPTQREQPV